MATAIIGNNIKKSIKIEVGTILPPTNKAKKTQYMPYLRIL